MVKNREINGTEEIALVTPTPGLEKQLDWLQTFCSKNLTAVIEIKINACLSVK